MKLIKYIFLLLALFNGIESRAQKIFSSLDSLVAYSLSKSITIKSGYIKLDQAKKAKLAAIYGVLDANGNASFNFTNNTKLPVSLFPAETFGGQAGTYQEIQTGIKYNSTANLYAEVKLLNLAGWQNIKLAKLNLNSIERDNQLSLKTWQENMASAYFNSVNLNEQIKTAEFSNTVADTLFQIVTNKYKQGLAKQQDVNTAKINFITTQESLNQLNFLIQQQYMALKLLADIAESENIRINSTLNDDNITAILNTEQNKLKYTTYLLKEKVAFNYYRQQQYSFLPTVSAFASNSNQQFSQQFKTFDTDARWINSNFIGIKAVWMLPTANAITQSSKAKYEYWLTKENTNHALLESNLEYTKLKLEYEKTVSQCKANKEVALLQKDNYYKNLELYKQGLIGLDAVMTNFNTMVNSNYTYNSSLVTVLLTQSKININNTIK